MKMRTNAVLIINENPVVVISLVLLFAAPVFCRECGNMDIRNNVKELEVLRGCQVVEGFVQILLIDHANETDYQDVSFPELKEITGYLLLYRVQGLKSIGQLFPNLAVIRGNKLFNDYALVVYEVFELQEVGLWGLTNILRGAVRIEKNPTLCYVVTIDWRAIASGMHFIKENKNEQVCPGKVKCAEFGCARSLCWGSGHCQKLQQDDCHEMCLGGCLGPGPRNCTVCKHVLVDGECVRSCPSDRYEYMRHRCVTEDQCHRLKVPETAPDSSGGLMMHYPSHGLCSAVCPSRYEVNVNRTGCIPCQGACRKVCGNGEVNEVETIDAVQRFDGCTYINGSLVIRLHGGEEVMDELYRNLGMVEEINGYLKIARSFSLTSLKFFKNLRIIHGNESDGNKSALIVLDNQNLQELWDWHKRPQDLKIINGRLFFHYNPRLCLSQIEKLKEITGAPNFTNLEVARESNGDKASCEVVELHASFYPNNSTSVKIEWDNTFLGHQSLIGYTVHYLESEDTNLTIHDGKDVCSISNWKVEYVMLSSDLMALPKTSVNITKIKPNTLYAYYVKTYAADKYQLEGRSEIQYFRTFPDRPSIPRLLKAFPNSSSEVTLSWQPPLHPHGNITHYIIIGQWHPDNLTILEQRDYCIFPLTSKWDENDETETTTLSNNPQSNCCKCIPNTYCISTNHMLNYMFHSDTFTDEDELCDNEHAFYDVFYNTHLFGNGGGIRYKSRHTPMTNKNNYTTENIVETSTFQYGDTQTSNNANTVHKPFLKKINADETFTVIRNLHHFGEYTMKVVACRSPYGNLSDEEFYERSCSPANIITFRTKKLSSADVIDAEQITIEILNNTGSVRIMWPCPVTSNAAILTYHLEYHRVDIEHPQTNITCISKQTYKKYGGSYTLNNLSPGKYSVRIKTTSLAGVGIFTGFVNFTLTNTQYSQILDTKLIIPLSLFIIVIIGVGISLYLWRKIEHNSRREILVTTVNPEYISLSAYVEDEWEIARDKIELVREISHGSFGMVYEGFLQPANIHCAVKTVAEKATVMDKIEFLNEASVMKSFAGGHHVVRLLGVVSRGQPPLVIMELMVRGDLKNFLRSTRDSPTEIHLSRVLRMAAEIADGMAYLEASKFVHRDLAARNCMVAEDLTVKIGDFGMTRDIYETDYYRKGNKGLLPVRWMAPESLEDGVFSSQSDVWSYGVVLWEIATLAEQPYQGLANEQVLHFVLGGGKLELPSSCHEIFYQLMLACWQFRPNHRPNFQQLLGSLELLAELPIEFQQVSFYHSRAGEELRESWERDNSSGNCTPNTRKYDIQPQSEEVKLLDFVDENQLPSYSKPNLHLPHPPNSLKVTYANISNH